MVDGIRTVTTKLLTMREASEILHVQERAVRRWCDEAIVKSYRVNASGPRLVTESSVKALISQMSSPL